MLPITNDNNKKYKTFGNDFLRVQVEKVVDYEFSGLKFKPW